MCKWTCAEHARKKSSKTKHLIFADFVRHDRHLWRIWNMFRFSWKHKGSQHCQCNCTKVKLTIKHLLATKSHLNFKQFCRKVSSGATNIGHAPAWNRFTVGYCKLMNSTVSLDIIVWLWSTIIFETLRARHCCYCFESWPKHIWKLVALTINPSTLTSKILALGIRIMFIITITWLRTVIVTEIPIVISGGDDIHGGGACQCTMCCLYTVR